MNNNNNKQHQNIESASTSEQPLQSSAASQQSKQNRDSNKVQTNLPNIKTPDQYFSLSGSQNQNATNQALDKYNQNIRRLQQANYIVSVLVFLNSVGIIVCSVYLNDSDHKVRQYFGYIESIISIILIGILTFINIQSKKNYEMGYIIFSAIFSLSCFFFIIYLELQKVFSSDNEAQPIIDTKPKNWYNINHLLTGLCILLPLLHLVTLVIEAFIYKNQQTIKEDYLSDIYSVQKQSYTHFIEQPVPKTQIVAKELEDSGLSGQNNNNNNQQQQRKRNPSQLGVPTKQMTYQQTPRFMTIEHQFQILRKTEYQDDKDPENANGKYNQEQKLKSNSRKSDLIENISNTFQVQDKKLNHQELTSSLLQNGQNGTDSPDSPIKPFNHSQNLEHARYTQQVQVSADGKKRKKKLQSIRSQIGYSSQSQIVVQQSVVEENEDMDGQNSSIDSDENLPPTFNNGAGESYRQFVDMHYNRKISKNQFNQIQGFQESDIY